MSRATHQLLLSIFGSILILCGATIAFAQENNVMIEANASAQAETRPIKPLDVIRIRMQEVKQNAVNARQNLQIDTRAQMQGAETPEERRAVMQNSVDARIDIARTRAASSTGVRMQVKALVHQHGGLIRERFALAVRQFNTLITRIESRIEKLKAEGAATAEVEAQLAIAKTESAEAQADIQAVASFVASIEENSDRNAVRAQLTTLVTEARASIRETHQALQQTVRALVKLRPAGAETSVSASTSVVITQ